MTLIIENYHLGSSPQGKESIELHLSIDFNQCEKGWSISSLH